MCTNALTLIKQHLEAGSFGAYASARIYQAHAASPMQEPADFIRMMESSFRAARVLLPDVETVRNFAANAKDLDQLIANLWRIVNKQKVGVLFSYVTFMAAIVAISAAILRYENTPDDEKNVTRSKKIMRIIRRVLYSLTDPELEKKIDEHEGSPVYKFMLTAWNRIRQFCKRLWKWLKSIFSHKPGADEAYVSLNIKKFLGVCVSAAGLAYEASNRVGNMTVDTKQVPGLPRIHTPISSPVVGTPKPTGPEETDGKR